MSNVNDSASLANNSNSEAAPPSEPAAFVLRTPGPQIALRSDGSILLSVEDIPPHVSLEGRERWTAIVIRGAEANLLRSRLADAEADVAARLVMTLSRTPHA